MHLSFLASRREHCKLSTCQISKPETQRQGTCSFGLIRKWSLVILSWSPISMLETQATILQLIHDPSDKTSLAQDIWLRRRYVSQKRIPSRYTRCACAVVLSSSSSPSKGPAHMKHPSLYLINQPNTQPKPTAINMIRSPDSETAGTFQWGQTSGPTNPWGQETASGAVAMCPVNCWSKNSLCLPNKLCRELMN